MFNDLGKCSLHEGGSDSKFSAQAVKLARQITVHHPNDAEAFFILGEALGMMNLEDEALEACNHSLKLNSEHVGSLVLSANAMLGKRKRDAGLKLITRALSLDPDKTLSWMIYGRLLRLPAPEVDRNEVAEKAVEAFNRVIALEKAGGVTPIHRRGMEKIAKVYNEEGDQNANLELNKRFPTTGKPLKPNHAREREEDYQTSLRRWTQLYDLYLGALICEENAEEQRSLRKDWLQQMAKLDETDTQLRRNIVGKDIQAYRTTARSRKSGRRAKKFVSLIVNENVYSRRACFHLTDNNTDAIAGRFQLR